MTEMVVIAHRPSPRGLAIGPRSSATMLVRVNRSDMTYAYSDMTGDALSNVGSPSG